MLLRSTPSLERKLEVLGEAARYDLSCGTCGEGRKRDTDLDRWIYPSVLPDGRKQYMLKVLMSNSCHLNCKYCALRSGGGPDAARLEPEEVASLFGELCRLRKASALFISSAVHDRPVRVMDDILKTAEIVRLRQGFKGYMHLKLLPQAEPAQIERAMELAERVSVNFEATSPEFLEKIAPAKKRRGGLHEAMNEAHRLMEKKSRRTRCRGLTTQYVVGPAGESDRDLLRAMAGAYRSYDLKRIYFSAHSPVAGTPLEDVPATPLWRENRLYQADFLLRQYGFEEEEFVLDSADRFDMRRDPKSAWAEAHPERFPIEINKAEPEELLRVPGIGPTGVKRIVEARRESRLLWPDELQSLGVRAKQAAGYLTFDGRKRYYQQDRNQLVLPLG